MEQPGRDSESEGSFPFARGSVEENPMDTKLLESEDSSQLYYGYLLQPISLYQGKPLPVWNRTFPQGLPTSSVFAQCFPSS